MKKLLFLCALSLCVFALTVTAQPRPAEKAETKSAPKTPAPDSFVAKYEGGLFGYSDKEQGFLKFDDVNERLIFTGKDGKEDFSIPYAAILVVSPNEKSVQSGTGRAVGAIPLPGTGIGGGLMKKKKNYLLVQFKDKDVDVQGTATFLLDTTELLESVIETLGKKAELTQRGNAYYRPRKTPATEL